jgi:hypothetical protein
MVVFGLIFVDVKAASALAAEITGIDHLLPDRAGAVF